MVQAETRGSTLSIGDVIDGRYEVRGHLGSGGMGDVWLVRHKELLQDFALKTLKPELQHSTGQVQRFLREARAAAALHSRHIVRVVDGRTDYEHRGALLPFIVMEHLKGISVEQRVMLYGPCSVPEASWLLGRLALALEIAHDSGLVHRDVKPANVFIAQGEDGEPIVKLGDFGIVKLMDEALLDESSITASGAFIGTPMYMAPEQLRAQRDIGPQADQWSFAMLAFYVLTGRSYFSDADSVADLIAAALSPKLSRPSLSAQEFPVALDAWFLKSCAQAPNHRFRDMAAQMKEFDRRTGNPAAVTIHPHAVSRTQEFADEPSLRFSARTLLVGGGLAFALMGAAVWHHEAISAGLITTSDTPTAPGQLTPKAELGRVVAATAIEPKPSAAGSPSAASSSNPSAQVKPAPTAQPNAGVKPSTAPLSPKQRSKPTLASSPSAVATASRNPRSRAPDNSAKVAAPPSATSARGGTRKSVVPKTKVPVSPSKSTPSTLQPSGAACTRSAQCQSGLCVAERCR